MCVEGPDLRAFLSMACATAPGHSLPARRIREGVNIEL
jgi:hypothetical protein